MLTHKEKTVDLNWHGVDLTKVKEDILISVGAPNVDSVEKDYLTYPVNHKHSVMQLNLRYYNSIRIFSILFYLDFFLSLLLPSRILLHDVQDY